MEDLETLYVCDGCGINAEPVCADDTPTTFEDYLYNYNLNLEGEGIKVRVPTQADNVDPRIDAVAVDGDDNIVGYYIWKTI